MRPLLAVLLLAFLLPAGAQEPRTIAVLSLIGDSLTILKNEEKIGSNLDRSRRSRVDLDSPALDHSTLRSVAREMKRIEPGAKTVLLGVRSKELFEAQARALDAGPGIQRVFDHVKPYLGQAGNATHLLLVTKHRSNTRTELYNAVVGEGLLEGLGFYVDANMPLKDLKTGELFEGFFAPFTYFLVSLVDLKDGTVTQHTVTSTRVVSDAKSATAWQALTGAQKVKMLEDMVGAGLAEALPRVLRSH
jgi:hypothetical protein